MPEALLIGSTRGTVADVSLPEAGDYVLRVYRMRSAARGSETASDSPGIGLNPPAFADSLSGGPDYWMVSGVGGGDALNLRAGPSTRCERVGKLAKGEVLENRRRHPTGDERRCSIRATRSGVTGWATGRYLVEARPAPTGPRGPARSAGCARAPATPASGSRSATGPSGTILFGGDAPVASDSAGALSFDDTGDLFVVRVGDERYEIPEAAVNGG